MLRALRLLARLGYRRGVQQGSRTWLYVWGGASVLAWLRRRAGEPTPVLHTEYLEPGESVRISVVDPGA